MILQYLVDTDSVIHLLHMDSYLPIGCTDHH